MLLCAPAEPAVEQPEHGKAYFDITCRPTLGMRHCNENPAFARKTELFVTKVQTDLTTHSTLHSLCVQTYHKAPIDIRDRGVPRQPRQSTFKFVEYHACHANRHSSSWTTTAATPIDIPSWSTTPATQIDIPVRGVQRLPHQSTFKFAGYHDRRTNRHASAWSTTLATPIDIQVGGAPRQPHQSTFKFVEFHACYSNRHSSSWSTTAATPIDIQVRGVPRRCHRRPRCQPHSIDSIQRRRASARESNRSM